jgi:radical SAM protein with 4Fe4S-binding SPASM domain
MDMNLYRKILSDIGQLPRPLRALRLYKDGEPLLHPHFVEMVSLAKRTDNVLRVETTTNASTLDRGYVDALLDAGLDRIVVSVEGVTEEEYARIAKAKIDMAAFVDTLRYLFARRGECQVHIKTVAQNLAAGEDKVFLDVFGGISDRIFIEEIVESWPHFESGQRDQTTSHPTAPRRDGRRKSICPYLFYSLAINSDGTVSTCCVDWNRALVVGDLNHDTIQDVWNGQSLSRLRQRHILAGRDTIDQCRSCGQIDHCSTENLDAHVTRLEEIYC